jgi:hypothetical protein
MENKIEHLKQEIQNYEIELKKLRSELNAFNAIAPPQPESNHPGDIAKAFRAAAVATAQKLTDTQGLKNAIAALEAQLAQKRSQFQELDKQQQHQERLKRIEVGKAEAKSLGDEINSLVSQLESKISELKTICHRYEPDYRVLNSKPDFKDYWRPPEFVLFAHLSVPVFLEHQGQLTLGMRPFDVFQSEREAQQKAQAERARQGKLAVDTQISAARQRETAKKRQDERERLEEILSVKMAELNAVETQRAKDVEQVARGVRLNLDRIDAFIESTNAEIQQLQNELDAVEQLE